jgi:hypothetical protein
MTKPYHEKIVEPGAWLGADVQNDDSWIVHLDDAAVADLDRAVEQLSPQGARIPFDASGCALPALQPVLDEIPRRLEQGVGFVLVRGLPRERYSAAECELLYWAICSRVGTPVSQNAAGERLCHVRDAGRSLADPKVRGYQTTAKLDFHCDLLPVDVLGLFCLRAAKSGGGSFLVSSLAVHNVLLDERPDLLDVLYQPFHADWRGDEPAGEKQWYTNPMYSYHDGRVSSRITTRFVFDSAARFGKDVALSELQSEALDAAHAIAERPEMRLAMGFQEGDMQFVNNHIILHAREEYEDYDEPERKRHLLRAWIALPPQQRRSLAPELAARYRFVEMGGIPKRKAA